MNATSAVTPLFLAPGAVLRIDNGRGVLVRAASGRLWITEAGRRDDVVLGKGEAARLRGAGRALVSAWRAARVVLETSRASAASIEIADREGSPGRTLAAGWPHVDRVVDIVRGWLTRWVPTDASERPPAGRHAILRQIRRRNRDHGSLHSSPDETRDALRDRHPFLLV